MSNYRKIDIRVWADEKFRQLSQDGKFFYLYLLTSPHSKAWGAYVLDDLYVQADLGYTPQKIKSLWLELANLNLTVRDSVTRLVAFPNWFKYNLPANEKTALACIRGIISLPKSKALSMYCKKSEWVSKELANRNLTVSEQVGDELEQGTRAMSNELEQEHIPGKPGDVLKLKIKFLDCVFLSDDESEKLKNLFGDGTQKKIKALNDYIMSTGKKYKSHYHTILNWENKNGNGNTKQVGSAGPGKPEKHYPDDLREGAF